MKGRQFHKFVMCSHTKTPPHCTQVPFFKFSKVVKRVDGGTKRQFPAGAFPDLLLELVLCT